MIVAAPSEEPAAPRIAGRWRRFFAFAIDGMVLGLPGTLLGLTFYDAAVELGQAGRAIGFVIALLYFGILDSRLGGGQTLGKRLLKIRVVDRAGPTITFARSVGRSLVVAVPYFLNGLWIAPAELPAGAAVDYALAVILGFAVFGGLGALVYLFLFNRRTRQSLQDLVADTFVVRTDDVPAPIPLRIARLHLVVVGCWGLLWLVIPALGTFWAGVFVPSAEQLGAGLDLQRALATAAQTNRVQVVFGVMQMATLRTGSSSSSHMSINAQLEQPAADVDGLALSLAAIVLKKYPDLQGRDILVINITTGFDLGIAAWSTGYRNAERPEEWARKIAARRPRTPEV